ncbi:MAG: hypothetical protein PHY35_01285 [Candidatus Omnitrophica bacterium]|nr:hypothetical protein [Candidatus Omnitrophota bacterium]
MKIKKLIILSTIFIAIILITFLITSNNDNTLPEEPSSLNVQVGKITPLPPQNNEPIPLPLVKRSITITKVPDKQQKNEIPPALPEKGIGTTTSSSSSYNPANIESSENSPRAGIVKEGKFPSPKEVKEMNSAGIVMY